MLVRQGIHRIRNTGLVKVTNLATMHFFSHLELIRNTFKLYTLSGQKYPQITKTAYTNCDI